MLTLQSQPEPRLPPGNESPPGVKVRVAGVTGTYLAPGSLTAPGATSPSNPDAAILTFIHDGYFVNISIRHGSIPESQTEQVMAIVVPRLG